MGGWHETSVQEAPPLLSPSDVAKVTTLIPGGERVVRPGDLVKLRAWRTYSRKGQAPVLRPPVDLWVWTGKPTDPGNDELPYYSWGWLGAASLQNALVGRTDGERFALGRPLLNPGSLVWAPKSVFAAFTMKDFVLLQKDNIAIVSYPEVMLAGDFQSVLTSEIEILAICPARLYRRTATLTQWGHILNVMDMNYSQSRRGTLRWSALEGDCDPPEGKKRFEIGPIYWHQYATPGRLYDWVNSYKRLRPPEKFPHEYPKRERESSLY